MRKSIGVLVLLFGFSLMLAGCMEQQKTKKLKDLEYTVVNLQDLPAALKEQIEMKKEEGFRMTYSDNEWLYIARGYGIQETGGYSVSVDDCYLGEDVICVKTTLHGPQVDENVVKSPSYPCIVLKTELRSEEVKFD